MPEVFFPHRSNLLSNAVKFTHEGSVELTVTIDKKTEDVITFRFEVKDSGIGMTSEQLIKIFEPFTQADNTIARKYGGTGLGLAISKNMIELMGGKLEVKSMIGVGSEFSFTLPFEMADESAGQAAAELCSTETKKPIFKGNILVCEDNEINQIIIREHLTRMGFDVTVAPNGLVGVELAEKHIINGTPFALIFMDMQMPMMDGLSAAKKLAELGNKTPVIALTANVMASDLRNYEKCGMSQHLSKPFKVQDLRECLLKYLVPVEWVSAETVEIIDAAKAIERIGGDEKIYKRILVSFVNNNKNTLIELREAICSRDFKLAALIAHSLRGSAGIIGAARLAEMAFSIEDILTNENTGEALDTCLESLEGELGAVLDDLKGSITMEKEENYADGIMNREKLADLIDKITPFLAIGDSRSLEFLSDINEAFRPVLDKYSLFVAQMERYDLEIAFETLTDIRNFMKL